MKKLLLILCVGVASTLMAANGQSGNNFRQSDQAGNYQSSNTSNPADQEVSKKVHDVLKAGWLSKGYPNVSFAVQNGNVTLRGSVASAADKSKIEDKIREISGVKDVNNQIDVIAADKGDNMAADQGSTAAADIQKKYPNDSATSEADWVLVGKIHEGLSGWFSHPYEALIVKSDNGNVTITGVVDKPDEVKVITDKVKAIDGVQSLNNQVTSKQ